MNCKHVNILVGLFRTYYFLLELILTHHFLERLIGISQSSPLSFFCCPYLWNLLCSKLEVNSKNLIYLFG